MTEPNTPLRAVDPEAPVVLTEREAVTNLVHAILYPVAMRQRATLRAVNGGH